MTASPHAQTAIVVAGRTPTGHRPPGPAESTSCIQQRMEILDKGFDKVDKTQVSTRWLVVVAQS